MPIKHRLAGRYARALFEVSVKEAEPRAVEEQLAGFVETLQTYPHLHRVLVNPVVPVPRKEAAVAELAERLGLAPVLTKLLAMLAERDALEMLPDLLERYRHRVLDHLGLVRAEVTTAVPLAPDRAEAVRRGLAALTGKQVEMVGRVDPAVIGGVVAKVGSMVYDGSVARQLERLRQKMIEGGSAQAAGG